MIFTPENIEKIKTGQKTQTRRIIKVGETRLANTPKYFRCVFSNGRLKWQIDKDYAVCPGRHQKQVARIVITDIHSERLHHIQLHAAQAEGYESRAAFFSAWDKINPKHPVASQPNVWVIDFFLMPEGYKEMIGE